MSVCGLLPSHVLSIENFVDPEAYRAHAVLGGGVSKPLQSHQFSARRAALALREGLFVLQRSFARELEAELGPEQGVGLLVPISFRCTINGHDIDDGSVGLMRGKTHVAVLERHPNTYLMARFNSNMSQRGWPEGDTALQFFRPQHDTMQRLRLAILDMFDQASAADDCSQFEALNQPIQERLFAALDDVFASGCSSATSMGMHANYRSIAARIDEYLEFCSSGVLYSGEIATAIGVSVRTLNTAMQHVHGMSLHQYLRDKRMWSIRKQLARGGAGTTVKSIALANGFSHMGQFSQSYKSRFGESPSCTLARARLT